jgi:hypothetical protein
VVSAIHLLSVALLLLLPKMQEPAT